MEGFSEALQYELRPLNIAVKVVEPGVIKTDFYDCSLDEADCGAVQDAYDGIMRRGQEYMRKAAGAGIEPRLVARTIYRAANDKSRRLRYPVGPDAVQVAILRRLLPEKLFYWVLARVTLG